MINVQTVPTNFDVLALGVTINEASFSRILSILRSSADISGLIAIPDDKELLHDRTRVASKALRNLTRMGLGRVLF